MMHTLRNKKELDIINQFSKCRIAVIGDVIIDRYLIGEVDRISPEAPIPVVNVSREYIVPGGAGNTAANITSLGAACRLFARVGNDSTGKSLRKELDRFAISADGLVTSEIPTTEKTRVLGNGQQIVRIDREKKTPALEAEETELCQLLTSFADEIDAIILCDYAKGVITPAVVQCAKSIAQAKSLPILADVRPEHMEYYQDLTIITPNRKEISGMVGFLVSTLEEAERAGRILSKKLNTNILITLSEDGMLLVPADTSKSHYIPTKAQQVTDVSGAGDTVIATMGLALAAGATQNTAAILATHAASMVVAKLGTATISTSELRLTFTDN